MSFKNLYIFIFLSFILLIENVSAWCFGSDYEVEIRKDIWLDCLNVRQDYTCVGVYIILKNSCFEGITLKKMNREIATWATIIIYDDHWVNEKWDEELYFNSKPSKNLVIYFENKPFKTTNSTDSGNTVVLNQDVPVVNNTSYFQGVVKYGFIWVITILLIDAGILIFIRLKRKKLNDGA